VPALIEPTRREDGYAQYDLHVHTEQIYFAR
jgi:quinol monooxygenase YgiN